MIPAREVSWWPVAARMKTVRLNWVIQLLVPTMLASSLPRRTRGLSYHLGKVGLPVGAALAVGSLAIGGLLAPILGLAVVPLAFWLFGSVGLVIGATALRPIAFVKPICTTCRLIPVVREHEAIHLAGVVEEEQVWSLMREHHTLESLGLENDPNVCTFCPIPKRLKSH